MNETNQDVPTSNLKWTYCNERTRGGGAILRTIWTTSLGPLLLEVTNWPGSTTLDWRIIWPGASLGIGRDESRHEHGVRSLKEKVVEKALKILNWEDSLSSCLANQKNES